MKKELKKKEEEEEVVKKEEEEVVKMEEEEVVKKEEKEEVKMEEEEEVKKEEEEVVKKEEEEEVVKKEGDCKEIKEKDEGEGAPRVAHKRKVAMFVAYLGKDYQGMQRNPDAVTIEATLERALVESGGVSDLNAGSFSKVSWSRSARTDKGVSALGQVVSLKLMLNDRDVSNVTLGSKAAKDNDADATTAPPADIVRDINTKLPKNLQILGLVRTTGGFCAKNECDRRVYEYVLPTFAFEPEICRERQYYLDKNMIDPMNPNVVVRENDTRAIPKRTPFDDEQKARLNSILSLYKGTHSFHNFTLGLAPSDPQCKRYILEFGTEGGVQEIDGLEFVTLRVKGQSFVLHQIRKMVGMAIAVMRGLATEEQLKEALQPDKVGQVPMAPAVGLYLVKSIFDNYNKRFKSSHLPIDLDQYAEKVRAADVSGPRHTHIVLTWPSSSSCLSRH